MYNNYNPYYPFVYQMGNGTMQDNVSLMRNQQIQPQPMPQAQNQNNNGLVWVQGEAGAKSYLVAPNTTVMLMDSENSVFYLKSADASGMPLPLRTFEYTERASSAAQASSNAPQSVLPLDMEKYVTHEQLDEILANISAQDASKKSKQIKEKVANG